MRIAWKTNLLIPIVLLFSTFPACAQSGKSAQSGASPQGPFTDYRYEKPGATHKITVKDLPAPYATKSAANHARVVARPKNAWPQAPAGFKVELFASGLGEPRNIVTAPNGDIFLAQPNKGEITIFRGVTADGKAGQTQSFATGLGEPYGIAFYPPGPDPKYVYVGETGAVLRFAYHSGDLKAAGKPEHIADLPGGGGHSTRDIVFSPDGKQLFVGVGSDDNVDDPDTHPAEKNRAEHPATSPGRFQPCEVVTGICNPGGGSAIDPKNGGACGVR